jgi:zinc/manganese transport system substrate-binding protein
MEAPLRTALVTLLSAALCATAALSASAGRSGGSAPLRVVAAENVWGSIAAQLGGDRAEVTSVIANPAADPHDYEPTALDARAFAGAQLAIVNGIGYDPWASKLLDANPADNRVVLDVGDLLGLEPGANPHRWYSPSDVRRVIAAISADYARLDPRDAGYFARQERWLETTGLARYRRLVASIRRRYRGVPVGASESIFVPLARALGLNLVTPPSFLRAISEGAEPTAADRTTIDRQVARRQIKVWVYNSQNGTPDVDRITDAARRRGIPVTTITETLSPSSATFQAWQAGQLEALAAALHKATGR